MEAAEIRGNHWSISRVARGKEREEERENKSLVKADVMHDEMQLERKKRKCVVNRRPFSPLLPWDNISFAVQVSSGLSFKVRRDDDALCNLT